MSSKEQMFAKVILASKPTNGAPPIITLHLRYPRFIHAEIMTHRVFSRNARSSRAVPIATMLKEIKSSCVIPWHWGKNQKGMQATEECNAPIELYEYQQGPDEREDGLYDFTREEAWLKARDAAVEVVEGFMEAGYHKQVANRLLEPFMWIDTLITSTSWANFFHLRDHKDAEPHFEDLAKLVRKAIDEAEYKELGVGEWHLPYITEADIAAVEDYLEPYPETTHPTVNYLLKISTARCARISYVAFDGDGSLEREIDRHDNLVASQPLHASPAEHQAQVDSVSTYRRQVLSHHCIGDGDGDVWNSVSHGNEFNNKHLSGNLGPGYIQYRKTLTGEYVKDKA